MASISGSATAFRAVCVNEPCCAQAAPIRDDPCERLATGTAPPLAEHALGLTKERTNLAVHVAPASPAEGRLVEATREERFLAHWPERLIGDNAYDSDGLDAHLRETMGIEMIAPNRAKRRVTQDGRPLRRYTRRWQIERLFAWFHNYRRLVVRWDRHPENFLAFFHLASALILLRRF